MAAQFSQQLGAMILGDPATDDIISRRNDGKQVREGKRRSMGVFPDSSSLITLIILVP